MADAPAPMPSPRSDGTLRSVKEWFFRGDRASPRLGRVEGGTPLGGRAKRMLDIVVALFAIAAFAPVAVLIALLILVTMGRPIFYGHPRVGFQRKTFLCHKFRSMVRDPDAVLQRHLRQNPEAARAWEESQKLQDDPRVTFVGRMLRKSSLDELPQLINVLRGDMSCVGPRPVVEDELERYGVKLQLYLSVRPGMSGLWQVSGRSSLDYAQRVALDETYVKSWSLWLDVKILFSTVGVLMRFDDAA